MINMEIDTVLYGNQILFLKSENTSFTGRDSLFFAWCSPVFMIVLNSLFEKSSLAKGVVDFSLRSEGIFTVSVVVLALRHLWQPTHPRKTSGLHDTVHGFRLCQHSHRLHFQTAAFRQHLSSGFR